MYLRLLGINRLYVPVPWPATRTCVSTHRRVPRTGGRERLTHAIHWLCVQLVELKNGEAYNGKMDSCDTWMNIHLKEVICTSKDGESFWRMKEVFIRGNTIKYIRVPDDTLGKAVEEKPRKPGLAPHPLNSEYARC
jgi:small nuclear ribonucleoprotein (snRNP)-like protein